MEAYYIADQPWETIFTRRPGHTLTVHTCGIFSVQVKWMAIFLHEINNKKLGYLLLYYFPLGLLL